MYFLLENSIYINIYRFSEPTNKRTKNNFDFWCVGVCVRTANIGFGTGAVMTNEGGGGGGDFNQFISIL